MRTVVPAIALMLTSACSPQPASGPPRILQFHATPGSIPSGRSVVLAWTTDAADKVTLSGVRVAPSGQFTTPILNESAEFVLEASNSSGSVERSLEVEVVPSRVLSIEVRSWRGQPVPDCDVTTSLETQRTDPGGKAHVLVAESGSWAMIGCDSSSWLSGFDGDAKGEVVLPAVIDGDGSSTLLTGRVSSLSPLPSGPYDALVVNASSPRWTDSAMMQPDGTFSVPVYGLSTEYSDFLPWALAWSFDASGRPKTWNGIAIGSKLNLDANGPTDAGVIGVEPLSSGVLDVAVGKNDNYQIVFAQVGAAIDEQFLSEDLIDLLVSGGATFSLLVPQHPRLSLYVVVSGGSNPNTNPNSPTGIAVVSGITTEQELAVELPLPVKVTSPSTSESLSRDHGVISWDPQPSSVYEVRLQSKSSNSRSLSFFVAGNSVSVARLVEAGFAPAAGAQYRLVVAQYGPFADLSEALSASGVSLLLRAGRTGYISTSEARNVSFE